MRRLRRELRLGLARQGEQLLLARLEFAHAPLGGGEVAPGLFGVGDRQRRACPARLIHRAAAIEVRLRQDVRLRRTFPGLRIHQHDLETRLGVRRANCIGKVEMHAEKDRVQHDGRAQRHGEHAIVAGREPGQSHVHSYFSGTSLS